MNKVGKLHDAAIWGTFALIAICLFAIQYVTLPKLRDFVISSSTTTPLERVRTNALNLVVTNLTGILSPLDYVLISALVIALIGLVSFEVFRNVLSRFFLKLTGDSKQLTLFLLFLSILCARYYLNPGHVFMGDAESLGIRGWMVSEHLQDLQWPVWSNYWYGGFPLLHYYAPLYFVVIAVFSLALNDFHLATKLVLWLTHIGSIFTMFYFLREATRNVSGALVGSLSYGIVFYRTNLILYQGDLNLCLVWLLYPLLFLLIERYLNHRLSLRRNFLLFSFVTAGLILTHHAYAFFGLVFAAVYLLVRVLTWEKAQRAKARAFGFFTLSAVGGFLISAFSLLPFILEHEDVRGLPRLPFYQLLLSAPSLGRLSVMLRWSPTGRWEGIEAYVGISVFVFCILSIIYLVRNKGSIGLALFISGLVAYCTLKGGSQYTTKNMNFVIFFMAALTGYAPLAVDFFFQRSAVCERLRNRWGRFVEMKLVLVLMGAILLDLGPTTFQNTFIDKYYDLQETMYAKIRDIDSNYRAIERRMIRYDPSKGLGENFEPGRLGIISAYSPMHTPLGRLNEASAKSISYNSEMIKKLHLDLNQESISDLSLKGLYLMGVKFLVFRDRHHYFPPPLRPAADYSISDLILELKHTRPVLFSTKVLEVKDVPDYEAENVIERRGYFDIDMLDYKMPYYRRVVAPLIERMNIDLPGGTADCLIVRDSNLPPSAAGNPHDVDVQIRHFAVTINTVEIRYAASGSGYGRLAFSYFPYLDVRLDGKKTKFFRDAMHCIVTPLPAGEHVISIHGRASPLRRWTFVLSLIWTLAFVFLPARTLNPLDHSRDS